MVQQQTLSCLSMHLSLSIMHFKHPLLAHNRCCPSIHPPISKLIRIKSPLNPQLTEVPPHSLPKPCPCCASHQMGRCSSFREAAEVVGRQAFPMFLNVTANVTNWSADGTECSLVSLPLAHAHSQKLMQQSCLT